MNVCRALGHDGTIPSEINTVGHAALILSDVNKCNAPADLRGAERMIPMAYLQDVTGAVDDILAGIGDLPARSAQAACVLVRPIDRRAERAAPYLWPVDPEAVERWATVMDELLGVDCLGSPAGDSLNRLSDRAFERIAAMAECVDGRANDN